MFGRTRRRVQSSGVRRAATVDVSGVVPGSAWKPGGMAKMDPDAGGIAGSGEERDVSVTAAWCWCLAGCLTWWWAVVWVALRVAGL
jgi:hypothetical protein